jgi:hypothetical protein
MDENEYAEMLDKNGIDVGQETVKKDEEEPKTVETKSEEPKEETPKEPEPLQTKEEPKKRSIYDEYKEKKQELRTEKELREIAEGERDELAQKLKAIETATTPKEKQEAKDDLDSFAEEINADPQALKRMKELFMKDIKPSVDENLAKDLQEFKQWKSENSQVLEKQHFEQEMSKSLPTIKEMLPNMSEDEFGTVKQELDKLAHTKQYHDKDLDYVVFKNKEYLSKFISPKKRGMETKGNHHIEEDSFEFNPDPDFSKMSEAQAKKWYEEYHKAGKEDMRLSNGKLVL